MHISAHPRTEPGGRDSRTGLPPLVFDGEANAGPGMKNAGKRQELSREFGYPIPGSAIPLTSLHERASPEIDCIVPKGPEAFAIGRNRMIRKVSADDLSKPFPLDRYGSCIRRFNSSLIALNLARILSRRVCRLS
jgi:hypothetical protein